MPCFTGKITSVSSLSGDIESLSSYSGEYAKTTTLLAEMDAVNTLDALITYSCPINQEADQTALMCDDGTIIILDNGDTIFY